MKKRSFIAFALTALVLLTAALCCVQVNADQTFGSMIYLRTDKTKTPYIYFWANGKSGFPAWPGSAMTSEGDNIYSYKLPCDISELTGVIFNSDSSGNKMTGDVTNITGNLYDLASSSWETYPVKFEYFGTDIKSVYVGSRVVISAKASSPCGDVKYKFYLNNSVLSDYSDVNSIVWQPEKAEKVTLLFEAKDAAGNVNSCELAVDVKDTKGSEEPIFLSAYPQNGSVVKAGEKVTLSVNGTGGEVNNKILFYKTEVIAPDGTTVNIPYYKTDSTAEFVPKLKGDYTVKMYIQNNTVENTTAEAVYIYTCNDGEEPKPTPKDSDTDVSSKPAPIETDTDITSKPAPAPTISGDYDGNGKTELEDAYALQDDVVSHKTFTKEQLDRADMNKDGKLTLKDATLIMRAVKDKGE